MQVMYTDIWTMPIYNWFKLLDTGNLGFINESSTLIAPDEVEVEYSDKLVETRHKLNNQFFKEFGQSQQTTTILQKKIELVRLKANFLHTGNKMNKTFIEIKEGEIKAIISQLLAGPEEPYILSSNGISFSLKLAVIPLYFLCVLSVPFSLCSNSMWERKA